MGMYDSISISDALPYNQEMKDLGLDTNNHTWQTKDLDCMMSLYFIQGGRLFLQKFKNVEWVPGNPDSDNLIEQIGYTKREDPYLEPVYHHGVIRFYDHIDDVQDKWDCWIEFTATFTNGGLDRYQLVEFKKTDSSIRKQRDAEWTRAREEEANIWYNKYLFNTKPYRWFARMWYRCWYKLGEVCNKIANIIT